MRVLILKSILKKFFSIFNVTRNLFFSYYFKNKQYYQLEELYVELCSRMSHKKIKIWIIGNILFSKLRFTPISITIIYFLIDFSFIDESQVQQCQE